MGKKPQPYLRTGAIKIRHCLVSLPDHSPAFAPTGQLSPPQFADNYPPPAHNQCMNANQLRVLLLVPQSLVPSPSVPATPLPPGGRFTLCSPYILPRIHVTVKQRSADNSLSTLKSTLYKIAQPKLSRIMRLALQRNRLKIPSFADSPTY